MNVTTPSRTALLEVSELITKGTTPKTLGRAYARAGFPFLRAENIQNLTINWTNDVLFIDAETDTLLARSRVRGGDVLVSIAGTIGRVGVVPSDAPAMNCNQAVAIVRPHSSIDNRYLVHWLSSGDAQQQIERAKVTATISNLSLSQLGALQVPLPPLPEQRRIADILDKADAIRRKRKEAIALTEELLRSAFLEMFGDPVTNPKKWPFQYLDHLAEVVSGVTKGKRYDGATLVEVPYMRVANVQDGHLVLEEVKTIAVSKEEAERYILKRGDVLLTEGGDPDKLGRGAVWNVEIARCIHQNHIFRGRVRDETLVVPEYLSALIGSAYGKMYFLRAAKQTTGIATINSAQLKKFPVLLPPLLHQQRYVRFVDRVRVLGDDAGAHAKSLDALFDSLVHRAFRGEL